MVEARNSRVDVRARRLAISTPSAVRLHDASFLIAAFLRGPTVFPFVDPKARAAKPRRAVAFVRARLATDQRPADSAISPSPAPNPWGHHLMRAMNC